MLSLPLPVRIFLCTQHADLRKSFDGLAQLVREFLGADPQLEAVAAFVAKDEEMSGEWAMVPSVASAICTYFS
jgi:hypothetical protein